MIHYFGNQKDCLELLSSDNSLDLEVHKEASSLMALSKSKAHSVLVVDADKLLDLPDTVLYSQNCFKLIIQYSGPQTSSIQLPAEACLLSFATFQSSPKKYIHLAHQVKSSTTADVISENQEPLYDLRGFLDTIKAYVVRTDTEGRYTYCNQSFLDTFIQPHQNVIGVNSMEHILPKDHKKTFEAVERCLSNPGQIVNIDLDKPSPTGEGIITTTWEFKALFDANEEPKEILCIGYERTELIKAQTRLEKEQFVQRLIYENIKDMVILFDYSFKVVHSSASSSSFLGKANTQKIKDGNYLSLVHPEDKFELEQKLKSMDYGESITTQYRLLNKEKFYTPIESSISKIKEQKRTFWIFISRNISENLKLKSDLARSEKIYKNLFSTSPDPILVTDYYTGDILDANSEFLRLTGYTDEEIVGQSSFDVKMLKEGQGIKDLQIALQEHRDLQDFNLIFSHKDGSERHALVSTKIVELPDQKLVIAVARNISKEVDLSHQLEEKEAVYQNLIQNSYDLIFTINTEGKILYISEQVTHQLGYSVEEFLDLDILDLIHPEDVDYVTESIAESVQNEGEKISQPYRVKTKNGKYKWYQAHGGPIYNNNGELIYLQSIARDITELMSKQKDFEFLQYAFDQHSIISITDPKGKITYANEKFVEISGYARNELVGYTHRVINSGFHDSLFFKKLWDTIKSGKIWRGRICNKTKSGALYWVQTAIVPRTNEDGVIVEYFAIRTDITDQVLTKEALIESEVQLQEIMDSNHHEIFAVNKNYELLALNETFKEQFKHFFNIELKVGTNLSALETFPVELWDIWKQRYDEAFKGQEKHYQDDYKDPEGIHKYVSVNVYPLFNSQQKIIGASVFNEDVTERVLAEQKLVQNSEQLERAQIAADMGSWELDVLSDKVTWSDHLYDLFEVPHGTPLNFQDTVELFGEKDAIALQQKVANSIAQNVPYSILLTLNSQSGHVKYIEAKGFPQSDSNEKVTRLIGTAQNVTSKEKAKRRITAQKDQMTFLSEFAFELSKLTNEESMHSYAAHALFKLFERKATIVVNLYSHEEASVYVKALRLESGLDELIKEWNLQSIIDQPFEVNQNLVRIFDQREIVQVEDQIWAIFESFSWSLPQDSLSSLRELKVKGIPLVFSNKTVGNILLVYKQDIPEINDTILESFAAQYALSITHQKAHDELKASKEYNQLALEGAQLGTWDLNLQSQNIMLDPNWINKLGFEIKVGEEISKEEWTKFIFPEDLPTIQNSLDEMRSGVEYELDLEIRIVGKNDQLLWVYCKGKKVNIGRQEILIGTMLDITDLKSREEQLLLFESIIKNTNDSILVTKSNIEKPGPTIVYANQALCDLSGYSLSELVGNNPRILQGEDTNRPTLDRIHDDLLKGRKSHNELLNYTKEGTPYWIDINIVPLKDADGTITHFIAVERDITEKKKRELELKDALMRFNLATKANAIGIWDFNVQKNYLKWDDNMFALYDVPKDEFDFTFNSWRQRVHPDDIERTEANFNRSVQSEKEFTDEFRIVCRDGSIKYLSAYSTVVRNDQGDAIRIVGINLDITSTKDAERKYKEALIEKNEILEALNEGFFSFSQVGKITQWNRAAEQITHIQREEALDKPFHQLSFLSNGDQLKEEILKANQSQKVSSLRGYLNDSLNKWLEATIYPTDHSTAVFFSDISELREKELELERTKENREVLINTTNDLIWSVDRDLKILSANDAFHESFARYEVNDDLELKEIQNAIPDRMPVHLKKIWLDLYDRALSGETLEETISFNMNEDVQKVIHNVSLYPITENDSITGVACYSKDVTSQVNMMHALKERNENLKEIAWMQSHVVRAPLSRIMGLVELFEVENQVEAPSLNIEKILEYIKVSAEELDQVIHDITDRTYEANQPDS